MNTGAPSREEIARKRLFRILGAHGIATSRTLEQKISDAGPFNQRIDPHILTPARNKLIEEGVIKSKTHENAPWYYLSNTSAEIVSRRLSEQLPIFREFQHGNFGSRVGQCLEIAINRTLNDQNYFEYLGAFTNLEKHDDSSLYSKEEPPQSLSGNRLSGGKRLDFLVRHPEAGWAGIEAKNIREWLYPAREEITDLLEKCTTLDCVPVLIARRIHFVTFKVLSTCGVVFHQNYNQLLPETNKELANRAKDKLLLGYHDIRTGNIPDLRLEKFFNTNLPNILPIAREKFDKYKDLLGAFANGTMDYDEFAGRVRRRSQGLYEDGDWDPPEEYY